MHITPTTKSSTMIDFVSPSRTAVREFLKQSKTCFYVYVYFVLGIPEYVGKGQRMRVCDHLKECSRSGGRTAFWGKHLRKALREHGDVKINLISVNSENDAFQIEKQLISKFGRRDLGTGSLYNFTDGGEGCSGLKLSASQKAQRKKTWGDSDLRIRHSVILTTAWTDEMRELQSLDQKRIWANTARRAEQSTRQSKPCTIDGISIFPSHKAMKAALGQGRNGTAHPNFKYI